MKNLALVRARLFTCTCIYLLVVSFLFSCDNDKVEPEDEFEELDFFEEEIAGKWSRYHAYDDHTDYTILNSDRTACRWEKHDTGTKKYKSYGYWKLIEVSGSNNVFEIHWGSGKNSLSSIDDYHYNTDQIWKGGYSNLKMSRSSASISCD